MKKIDLEAHFVTKEYLEHLRARKEFPKLETIEDENRRKIDRVWYEPGMCHTRTIEMTHRLLDLGNSRLKEMEAAAIDMQLLSLCDPGCDVFDASEAASLAKKTNERLSQVVKQYPDKFMGMATLSLQFPIEAANELERAINELGLSGANINSNIRGEYLDDFKYWPILEKAEKLRVPISLHPTVPSPSMRKPYAVYGYSLAGGGLGFAAETALHAMRLICSGVFDKYPKLKIILGHLGEGLPFFLNRLDLGFLKPPTPGEIRPKCERKPSDYLRTNFIVTTSGMFFHPSFLCVYLALGGDNMAFAIDYPFMESNSAVRFIETAPICESDLDKISHLNAERLLDRRYAD